MKNYIKSGFLNHFAIALIILFSLDACAQKTENSRESSTSLSQSEIDNRVQKFLNEHRSDWHSLNVPYQDGKTLHDLIIKNNYTSALEIGTSTGHSTIWIAWAMSKTGGKVTTIEINEQRHNQAIENLNEVGLMDYVDARHADAHKLVKELQGPYDFVFSDADKGWYTQYFKDVDPKLKVGGCFTAHNVLNGFSGVDDFLYYIRGRKNYETTINRNSSSGISISYKKSD